MKLGIDYGTSTTLVSFTDHIIGKYHTDLLNIGGKRSGYMQSSIPSIIAINQNHEMFYGYEAEDVFEKERNTVILLRSLKRCLACENGDKLSDIDCFNPAIRPYCIGEQKLRVFGKTYSVQDLVSRFLSYLLSHPLLKPIINSKLDSFGISVPAMFGSNPRKTVYDILLRIFKDNRLHSEIPIDVINEPTAAIVACLSSIKDYEDGIYAICDIGGGTTDIVVFEKNLNHFFFFKPFGFPLAGNDVDKIMIDRLYDNGLKSKFSLEEAYTEVRRAKELLSKSTDVTVFGRKLTRTTFQSFIEPILKRIVEYLRNEIKEVYNKYKPYTETRRGFHLKKILLSGGGSKIPFLIELIKDEPALRTLEPTVAYISSKDLYPHYQDDTPIVVVAYGTSMPKDMLSEAVQYMLPYSIYSELGRIRKEEIEMFSELPKSFVIKRNDKEQILLFAADPNRPEHIVYDLGGELFLEYIKQDEYLDEFLNNDYGASITFNFSIDKFNILRVTTNSLSGPIRRREYRLPWQGGVEPALFEKYKAEQRKQIGFH